MSRWGIYSEGARGPVGLVGEPLLIEMIRGWLGRASPPAPAGIGDDCAVLGSLRGRSLLTIDPVVCGIHFDVRAPGRAVGAKLFRRNLSDIAAMGGRPVAAVVALALDPKVDLGWLEGFYRSIARESLRHGVPVVGGDLARLPGSFVATMALVGEGKGRVLARTGSRVGDWIYVTGCLGRSLPTGHHLRFTPRLQEGAWLARRREVRAMMDVSDGLAKDIQDLEVPHGAPAIYGPLLPRRDGATVAEAMRNGEDYELLFSVAPGAGRAALEKAWRRAFPRTRLTCIGRFVPSAAVPRDAMRLGKHSGYVHFR